MSFGHSEEYRGMFLLTCFMYCNIFISLYFEAGVHIGLLLKYGLPVYCDVQMVQASCLFRCPDGSGFMRVVVSYFS